MCFVDLRKTHDSVDREHLWQVLIRAGIPHGMIAMVRQFHDGMQARARMDGGELSEWFEVTRGVRQGCALSPPLFNISFAAALETVLVRFSEDDMTIEDMVFSTRIRRHFWKADGEWCGECCMPMKRPSCRGPLAAWRG